LRKLNSNQGCEAEAVETVKFLWKRNRKHFEERSWKRKGAFFIKHGAGMWKLLNFCGNGSILRKKLEAEDSEATNFIRSRKRKQNLFYCFHTSDSNKLFANVRKLSHFTDAIKTKRC